VAVKRLTFCYYRAIEPLEESLLIFLQYSNGFSSRLFVVKAKGQRLYDFFAGQPKFDLRLTIHADQSLGENKGHFTYKCNKGATLFK